MDYLNETQEEFWTRIIFNEMNFSCSIKETSNPIELKGIILDAILEQYEVLQKYFLEHDIEPINEEWFYNEYKIILEEIDFVDFNITFIPIAKCKPIEYETLDTYRRYNLSYFTIHPKDKTYCKFVFDFTKFDLIKAKYYDEGII